MKRFIGVLAATAFAIVPFIVMAQSGNDLFQKALSKERVDGQFTEAIALYERLVKEFASDRALAARALVQIGRCYERLGKPDARKVYERVVQEYADQRPSADEARARLAALQPVNATPAGLTIRRVWTGSKVDILGSISSDGRYLSFPDWETGDLALHDFSTGTDRHLTDNGQPPITQYAEESAISPDGQHVAYSWYNGRFRYELRTVSVQTGASAAPRRLYDNEDVYWVAPHDWSPDGRWIAVQIRRKDRTAQIGLVSVQDGSLRVLKSVDWRGPSRMFFSPDGKYLAFDLPVGEGTERDVFALAVDGSREIPAVVHPATDIVVGWTPDGSRLLFSSDRTGVVGLWSLAFSNGTPRGSAELIKSDVGQILSLGLTASGALYLGSRVAGLDVHIASIDFSTGRLQSTPLNPIPSYIGSNTAPQWSRDGRFLAYVSRRDVGTRTPIVGILSVETGQVRELRTALNDIKHYQGPQWSPDGRFVAVEGIDLKGRTGIFQIDVQTGDVSAIVLGQPEEALQFGHWSPDGKTLYYRRGSYAAYPATTDPVFVERDLVSGAEREIYRHRPLGALNLSPDGRWIAQSFQDQSAKTSTLIVIPVAGGDTRELFRVRTPDYLTFPAWAADGSFVIACKITLPGNDTCEHWQIPFSGGEPQRLDVNLKMTRRNGWISVHPDGRQIAYASGHNEYEVSVMEHFLPPAKTTIAATGAGKKVR